MKTTNTIGIAITPVKTKPIAKITNKNNPTNMNIKVNIIETIAKITCIKKSNILLAPHAYPHSVKT
jgi:hypothetical protein